MMKMVKKVAKWGGATMVIGVMLIGYLVLLPDYIVKVVNVIFDWAAEE